MSIKVDVADIARTLRDFDLAYLISVDPQGRPKVIAVQLQVEGAALVSLHGSRGTAANLESNRSVTVLCPPREPSGMSLLIDGQASAEGERFRITPESAILHRPAPPGSAPKPEGECRNDCEPL